MGRPNKHPDQFRRDALELVKTSERPIAEVARSLGIGRRSTHIRCRRCRGRTCSRSRGRQL